MTQFETNLIHTKLPSFLLNVFLGIYKRYVYWKNPLPSSGKNYSNQEDYSEENSIVLF